MKEKAVGYPWLKVGATTVLALLAGWTLWQLYAYYTYAPHTRDGRLRADTVPLAADVSGRVDAVMVHDNQVVRRGQTLFVIDTTRLANDLAQADAAVATAQAQLAAAQREATRYRLLADVVAPQEVDTRRSAVDELRARHAQALAVRQRARIDLERARVVAPVNGIVTNFSLRPGAYATAGQPVMALLDQDSFYVSGYFEETKLARMRPGMRALVRVMGEARPLRGHVEGVSAGVEDRDRSTAPGTLLASVNPSFSWIRLAQRVPVRIALDEVPAGVALVAGRSATISLEEDGVAP